jgi:hypothetical protein
MNEKDSSGRECNECANEKSGLRRESGSYDGHTLPMQERQGSVLTNQCLGKKRILSEERRNPPSLTDSDKLIVARHDWALFFIYFLFFIFYLI